MADKIKKIKIKQADGNFGDYIPLGADAANVDLTDGSNVETAIDNIKTQLEEPIEYTEISNIPDLTVYAKTENLSKVATSNDYNDLDNKYELPIATQTTFGGVKIDGSSITINDGVISSHALSLPTPPASSESTGVVKPDNITTKVMDDGTLYVNTVAVAPQASSTTLGVVQPDNNTITIDTNGIISAVLSGTGTTLAGLQIQKGTYTGDKTSATKSFKDIGITPTFVIVFSPSDIPSKGPNYGIAFIASDFMMIIEDWGEYVISGADGDYPAYQMGIARYNDTYITTNGFYIKTLNYTGIIYNYIAFYDPNMVDLGTPEE